MNKRSFLKLLAACVPGVMVLSVLPKSESRERACDIVKHCMQFVGAKTAKDLELASGFLGGDVLTLDYGDFYVKYDPQLQMEILRFNPETLRLLMEMRKESLRRLGCVI